MKSKYSNLVSLSLLYILLFQKIFSFWCVGEYFSVRVLFWKLFFWQNKINVCFELLQLMYSASRCVSIAILFSKGIGFKGLHNSYGSTTYLS